MTPRSSRSAPAAAPAAAPASSRRPPPAASAPNAERRAPRKAAASRRPSPSSASTEPTPSPVDGQPRPPRRRAEPRRARRPLASATRSPGIPAGDWLAAFQYAAREVFGDAVGAAAGRVPGLPAPPGDRRLRRRRVRLRPEVTERFFMAALRPIAEKWFRVEVRGVENIPAEGGALVVSNHSGTIPVDGLMTMVVDPRPHRPLPAPARRRPGVPDAVRQRAGPQGRRHAGLQRGRRADAARRRAGRRLARGLQGHRQAVLRALQAAAVRPRRLRVGGAAHRRPDRAAVGRRRRGDLPAGRQHPVAGAAARRALHPDHAVLPAARAARPGAAAVEVAAGVRRADPHRRATTRSPPTTRCWSSTSPTRCARRSSRRSTPC